MPNATPATAARRLRVPRDPVVQSPHQLRRLCARQCFPVHNDDRVASDSEGTGGVGLGLLNERDWPRHSFRPGVDRQDVDLPGFLRHQSLASKCPCVKLALLLGERGLRLSDRLLLRFGFEAKELPLATFLDDRQRGEPFTLLKIRRTPRRVS